MAGIYLHIPFCKNRCIYCGFYSTVRSDLRQQYVDALCHEMQMRSNYFDKCGTRQIDTIYMGGGTPSQLSPEQLQQLFRQMEKVFIGESPSLANADREITIECNPDDVTEEYAAALGVLPVNRVSMGAQTFDSGRLRFIHRRHTPEQVVQAAEKLRAAGISNISIDLMYGFPEETLAEWQSDIDAALAIGAEHISAYSLMYEEGTRLFKMMEQGLVKEIAEELSLEMYNLLIDRLEAAGYEHYEISNFARQGFRSRHNSSYWQGIPYIGLGAAAHSFDLSSRQWNVSDIGHYIHSIENGKIPMEREWLDENTRYNDTVMLSLRTCEGIDMEELEKAFGSKHAEYCKQAAERFVNQQLLITDGHRLRLSRKGLFVSDMIMSELMRI